MAYIDQYTLSTSATFTQRVEIAMVTAALAVATEAETGKARKDQLRNSLAVAILNNPAANLNNFVLAVVANAAITTNSLDSDIQFTVNSVFSSIAGVRTADN